MGDLEEEFREKVVSGRALAGLWFWRQTVCSLGAAGVDRLRLLAALASPAEIRLGLRTLARSRGFTVTAVATLALSMGATTAVFSVVDGVLLRPLLFPEENELVIVRNGLRPGVTNSPDISFSDRGYWHFLENNRAFEAFGGFSPGAFEVPLTGDGPPIQVGAIQMTASAFDVLGVQALVGRVPSKVEDVPGAPATVVLSHGLWSARYGEDPGVVGRSIDLSGKPRIVIGIMPPGFEFPTADIDAWVPFQLDPGSENFGGHHIEGIGRLREGVSAQAAESDAQRLIGRYGEIGYGEEWFADVFDGTASLTPLRKTLVGDFRRPLLLLFGAVVSVLLIACTNVATLFLVRADVRRREHAIRRALGSSRIRLARTVMTESLLVSLLGGAGGLLLALISTRALVGAAPDGFPRLAVVGVGPRGLGFTLAVSASVGVLCGFLPALRAGTAGVAAGIADGARGAARGARQSRTRGMLVGTQIALVVVLVVGSGLMVRTLGTLQAVDPGFDDTSVLTFRIRPVGLEYASAENRARFWEELLERLRSTPGVGAVGAITTLPLSGEGPLGAREVEEFPAVDAELAPTFGLRRATPGYFEAMGIPVVEGRGFLTDDHRIRATSIIISESIKNRYWPDRSALGKVIGGSAVVGVVGDVRGEGLDRGPESLIYNPMLDSAGGAGPMTVTMATSRDPLQLAEMVRGIVGEIDPDLPVTDVVTMSRIVERSLSRFRYTMLLLVTSALVALFLAAVGIYGLISYIVVQRTAEIGLRRALGATPRAVYRLVLAQGMTTTLYGLLAGLLGSVAATRTLEPLLYEIRPGDPSVLLFGTLGLLAVAILAMLLPARRAAMVPPATAFRGE